MFIYVCIYVHRKINKGNIPLPHSAPVAPTSWNIRVEEHGLCVSFTVASLLVTAFPTYIFFSFFLFTYWLLLFLLEENNYILEEDIMSRGLLFCSTGLKAAQQDAHRSLTVMCQIDSSGTTSKWWTISSLYESWDSFFPHPFKNCGRHVCLIRHE